MPSLDHALGHLPARAHLIGVTRADPALRLASYQAAGRLAEVRASQLAFTSAEAHALLVTRGGIALGVDEIDVLVERTAGWPAALVLAGIWLRNVDDVPGAVRAFGGDNRYDLDPARMELPAREVGALHAGNADD
jgi:LuxR family maltose regulon positive regulatory protein